MNSQKSHDAPMMTIDQMRAAAASTGESLWRRAVLVRQPQPEGVKTPALGLLLAELAALGRRGRGEIAEMPEARAPMPVMILPGFGAHPARMRRMAEALERAGHVAYDWGLGFNLGPTQEKFAFLERRLARIARASGRPVALVGWSLGGLFARELARRNPHQVAKVITMGTPFSGDRRANNAWRAYQAITGHAVDQPPIAADFAAKPPVPTIALWSPRDGVVAPRSACGRKDERDRAVALRCNHLGFASSAEAIREVLRQLDRED